MLARMAMASPAQAISTRAFSTTLRLRIAQSTPSLDKSSPRPIRSNPLVGNYVFPEPAQPKQPPPPPKSTNLPLASRRPPSPTKTPQSTADLPPPPPPPSKSGQQPTENPSPSPSPFAYNANDTRPIIDIANIISDKSAAYGRVHGVTNPQDRTNVRAKAVAGRTVFIKDRLTPQSAPTPAVALRVLDRMCRDQKIRNKFHSQKFHERKGLRKKRLRSQRWRARFKTGFRAAVSRVMELKKQGW